MVVTENKPGLGEPTTKLENKKRKEKTEIDRKRTNAHCRVKRSQQPNEQLYKLRRTLLPAARVIWVTSQNNPITTKYTACSEEPLTSIMRRSARQQMSHFVTGTCRKCNSSKSNRTWNPKNVPNDTFPSLTHYGIRVNEKYKTHIRRYQLRISEHSYYTERRAT